VTGAAGFVGANLLRRLTKSGFRVHILIREDTDLWRIKKILRDVSVHHCDLRDKSGVSKVVRAISPSIVYHLAAETISSSTRSMSGRNFVAHNLLGTINLLTACLKSTPSLIVNTGSSSEYGSATKPMSENDHCEPMTAYGVTKLAATLYGQMLAQTNGLPVVTLRLFSPFGPYDSEHRLIPNVVLSAINNRDIQLSSLHLVRDYVYIGDVVNACIACLSRKEKLVGKVFNVGSGKQRSIGSVVRTILHLTESKSRILTGTRQPPAYESAMWQANLRNTRKVIGWKPTSTFLSGIQKTVRWFQRNRDLYAN